MATMAAIVDTVTMVVMVKVKVEVLRMSRVTTVVTVEVARERQTVSVYLEA